MGCTTTELKTVCINGSKAPASDLWTRPVQLIINDIWVALAVFGPACLVSDHLWMPFKTKPAPLWSPFAFDDKNPNLPRLNPGHKANNDERWSESTTWSVKYICSCIVTIWWTWKPDDDFKPPSAQVWQQLQLRDGTLKDCQGDNLTVTQRHVWLIGWVIDHQPPLRSTKGEKELAAHWLSVDSRLSLFFCFSFDSCSSVFLLSQLRITECGCAQSCSPLQAGAVIPWWTLDNVSNKQCELLYPDQQRTISTTETTHSLLRIYNLTNTCTAAMLSMRSVWCLVSKIKVWCSFKGTFKGSFEDPIFSSIY